VARPAGSVRGSARSASGRGRALLLWLLAPDRTQDQSERRHELPDLWPATCCCQAKAAGQGAVIASTAAPIVLEGRYRLLLAAPLRMQRSRRGRWALGVGSGAVVTVLALLVARHFATTTWPLSSGHPGLLVAVGVLLLFAHMLKAYGWGRLFTADERPKPLALAAG